MRRQTAAPGIEQSSVNSVSALLARAERLFEQVACGLYALLAVAGQWQHTYNAFVTHPGKRDWVSQLTAIGEHERWRTPHPKLFLPLPRLGQYRLSRETAVEFSRDSVNVEADRLRKFEQ